VTKKICATKKRRRLHGKRKRTMIVADDKPEPVFGGKKQGTMLEMTKIVYKSPIPLT